MPEVNETPKNLKPYLFHGVDLRWAKGSKDAVGDCPMCGAEGKFSVEIETSKYQCWRCLEKGEMYTFIRRLWDISYQRGADLTELATNRKISTEVLNEWHITRSIINDDTLIPGYTTTGKLNQLYKYVRTDKGMAVLGTPGMSHCMFGTHLFDASKPNIFVCEGPWDGMALYETFAGLKYIDDTYQVTGNRDISLLANNNILSIPGCGSVGKPFLKWLPLFAGKNVTLMFDNDHPRSHPKTGQYIAPGGLEATKRAAKMLSESASPPLTISFLEWGADGYNEDVKHGADVRDLEYSLIPVPSMEY